MRISRFRPDVSGRPIMQAVVPAGHQRRGAHHEPRGRARDDGRALVVRHLRDALAHGAVQVLHPHKGMGGLLHRVQDRLAQQVAAVGGQRVHGVDIGADVQRFIDAHAVFPPFASLS